MIRKDTWKGHKVMRAGRIEGKDTEEKRRMETQYLDVEINSGNSSYA